MFTFIVFLLAWQLNPFGFRGAKATVLLFVRSDCPVSNRYAPDLQRLDQEFSPKGVQFRLVYVEPGLTSAAMEKHRREYGYSMPGVLDADHQFVRRAGVGITPEAAVFVQDDLVYRGRIDDRYMSVGKERPRALHHDLEEVLSGILAGKRLSFRETQAVGCVIEKVE